MTGHQRAQEWFAQNSNMAGPLVTFTQASCVRILSNPSFSSDAVTPQEALKLLTTRSQSSLTFVLAGRYQLLQKAVESIQKQIVGHQQVSDAYLLGLAYATKARLATMDRGCIDATASR